jgi:hypothetical protein
VKNLLLILAVAAALPVVGQEKASAAKAIPHALDGKPDLSGLWDHPFVIDMSKDGRNDNCGARVKGCSQKGPGGELPMTPWAADWTKNFDASNYDATGHCNPMGYTRSMNAPVPTQIVQTPKQVVFLHESMFAFHVVYLDGRRHPTPDEAGETTWYGHSVGRWEGDTLVVETTNFTNQTHFRGASKDLKVTERFTRADANTIVYKTTIEDPSTWTKPWTLELPFVAAPGPIYEYACHEGNYAIEDILGGARKMETEAPPRKK